MAARRLFVTGTDTGVGKTFVGCALVASARKLGLRVAAAKPLESGCARGADGALVPADALLLRDATGRDDAIDLICACRFEAPLAPAYAAEVEGVTIDPARIVSSLDVLSAEVDLLIIEGAGGALVPAWTGMDMVDLVALCRAEALIVARTGLGTINHTRLTVEALRARGVKIAGLVFNRPESPAVRAVDPSEAQNPARIAALTGLPVWAVFEHATGSVTGCSCASLQHALTAWIRPV
ncbi:MAG: dethiobiotin synthase [Deltaproteobacteria bacterium]|nr:dethiobiotin synthase [Deltaproteobacteria bacterium]